MEQIQVIVYALLSFFGVENGRVGAEITTVTINSQTKIVEIIQEDLFTVIRSEEDKTLVLKQLEVVRKWEKGNDTWIKDLNSFPEKTFTLLSEVDSIAPRITLKYEDEKDLRNLGIWYNATKNEFSINHIPRDNLKTTDGKLVGNYWVFSGKENFSYRLEPFVKMPEKFKEFKMPLSELLPDIDKKE